MFLWYKTIFNCLYKCRIKSYNTRSFPFTQERIKEHARRVRREMSRDNVKDKYREAKEFLVKLKHIAKEVNNEDNRA